VLRDEGLINNFLRHLGVISDPLPLLYNDGSILLGLVYTFLPFMVLPIYSTLERIDPRLIEAAYDLYASRWDVFKRVVWPLAKPGALAGTILVFAPALGSFLAPDLLGGGKKLLIGSLIQMQFTSSRNWPFGAALSTAITVLVLLVLLLQARRGRSRALQA
jgi:spermidine/putrescine transport system permease protein